MEITAREASLTRISNLKESILESLGILIRMDPYTYTLNTLYRVESALHKVDKDLWGMVDDGEVESA